MNPKKKLERQYLDSFKFLCRDFPHGELEDDREIPDYVVRTGKKRIGIEIARIYKAAGNLKHPTQAVEATKESITVAARMYAENLELPPVHVTLFFTLQRHLSNNKVQDIAQRVAQVVREYMPPIGGSVSLEYVDGRRKGQPIEVDLILINRVHPVDRHEWTWLEMGAPHINAVQLFQQVIEEKSARLNDYLRDCDECWLLIVAPSFRPSGMIHPDTQSLSHTYNSPFSRTYFLDFGRGSVASLS